MNLSTKGKSPFYPGQPVPVELFAGRQDQIDHIIARGIRQVEAGKPVAMYLQGEYGIGKSSIAGFTQWLAEREHGLHAIYVSLGTATSLDEVGKAILEGTIRSGAFDPKRTDRVKEWLARYIGQQSLFGLTLRLDEIKKDAPEITAGLLPFLAETISKLKDTGVKGVFLVLDEINGISANPKFAHFLKGIVDTNAISLTPVPLMLMLCGVEERRRELIRQHQPIDRIFDVIEVKPMSESEMKAFFTKAFSSAGIRIEDAAMKMLTEYSAGFPKIMHLLGDAAFWIDDDGIITKAEALRALLLAAEEVGKKYVDQQVYQALRSKDYHSILRKIAATGLDMTFQRASIASGLTESERRKLNNFLQKMKKLKVIRSGNVPGEYIFNMRMVRLYIWMNSLQPS
jgi:hypothetical protein